VDFVIDGFALSTDRAAAIVDGGTN